ncbi:MAG: Fic/DOC family N-terminal domain-containing protein [Ignavibacteriaceae bacterium]
MSFDPNKPFNDLPPLPPREELETKNILKHTINAARTLSELKGATGKIPNPDILINSIVLQEAKSSSAIENIVTTNDQLYKALAAKSKGKDPSAKEVVRYREALWDGFTELKNRKVLTTNLFIKIFQKIKDTDAGIRKTPGTKLINSKEEVIYTPPEGENIIRNLLSNLEKYIHDDTDNIDPLIKAAVIHYQFESIHPFTDGNGRTGRIILILYFILTGHLELPVLYLSKYIIENKNDYYKLLRGVTEKRDWEALVLYILNGIERTAKNTIDLIDKIDHSLKQTFEIVRKNQQSPIPKEVIELIYEQPYSKSEFIIQRNIAARKAAERYFKELERLKIIKPEKVGKEVLYINIELFDILSGK